ncbi:type I-E CRISPR-associated protein Cas6/Cse3/CasE [Thiolapillus sp.]
MYLSRIHFTREGIRRQCRRGIASNLFREHQMIWRLFGKAPNQQRDFLYRREDRPGEPPFYYLLSARQPLEGDGNLTVETRPFEPRLQAGNCLQFQLRVNAVVTRKADDHGKRRIRRDIIEAWIDGCRKSDPLGKGWPPPSVIHHQAASTWLNRQGEKHGFQLGDCLVSNHRFHKVWKPGDPHQRHFTSLDIQGSLTVTEPDAYLATLKQGLGRAKAFGCGLMLIRRA